MSNFTYPKVLDLIGKEVKTIGILRSNPTINKHFKSLAKYATDVHPSLVNFKKQKSPSINFNHMIKLDFEGERTKVFLGSKICTMNKTTYSLVTHYFTIYSSNKERILRRFHIDYAIPGQPGPRFHLQYAGELTELEEDEEIKGNNIDSYFSLPRMNHHPVTLALLLDIIFCAAEDEKAAEIRETPFWRDLVKNNEDFILAPYYRALAAFSSSGHTSTNLFRDFCYDEI